MTSELGWDILDESSRLPDLQQAFIRGVTMNDAADPRRVTSSQPFAFSSMTLLVWLTVTTPGFETAVAQPPSESMPLDNEVFADAITSGRVTQRFEIYNPHSEEQLQTVKQMGFTQVILDWPQLHAAATQIDLDVVIANWWTVFSSY